MMIMAAVLAFEGCATVGVTHLREDLQPKDISCPLQVFTSSSPIKAPYEEVCLIDSRTGGRAFDQNTVAGAIDQARGAACGCGADALIVMDTKIEGPNANTWGQGSAVIKAIRFTPKAP
jgi:hypothetical protein